MLSASTESASTFTQISALRPRKIGSTRMTSIYIPCRSSLIDHSEIKKSILIRIRRSNNYTSIQAWQIHYWYHQSSVRRRASQCKSDAQSHPAEPKSQIFRNSLALKSSFKAKTVSVLRLFNGNFHHNLISRHFSSLSSLNSSSLNVEKAV